jgi:hypothetical protein
MRLGQMSPHRLGVIARTSSMACKQTSKSVAQIGQELGVDYVVEGSVRREGDCVRITAQLIRVRDQIHLWAENYDRRLPGLLERNWHRGCSSGEAEVDGEGEAAAYEERCPGSGSVRFISARALPPCKIQSRRRAESRWIFSERNRTRSRVRAGALGASRCPHGVSDFGRCLFKGSVPRG